MVPRADRLTPAPPPDDLSALRGWLAAQEDADLLADLPIREIVVRADALSGLAGLLDDLGAPARVVLVQDDRPYERVGAPLKRPSVRSWPGTVGRSRC